jgi:L-cystine transport system permease protein
MVPKVASALPTTLLIMVFSLLFGMIIAVIFTFFRLKNRPVSRKIVSVIISFLRGTPEIVLLFLLYFGIPQILQNLGINTGNWDKLIFVVAAFSLNISAFLSEVLRSSYLSVDRGQQEASLSVGMNEFQAFRRIIFPQAFAVALPNLNNTIIILFKDTSLAFTIGVVDLIGEAKIIGTRSFGANQLQLFICVAVIYWVVCFLLEKGTGLLEHFYKKGHRSMA